MNRANHIFLPPVPLPSPGGSSRSDYVEITRGTCVKKLPRAYSPSAIKPDKPSDLFRDAETASSDFHVRTAGCAVFLIRFRDALPPPRRRSIDPLAKGAIRVKEARRRSYARINWEVAVVGDISDDRADLSRYYIENNALNGELGSPVTGIVIQRRVSLGYRQSVLMNGSARRGGRRYNITVSH